MKTKFFTASLMAGLLVTGAALTSCDNEKGGNDVPDSATITIENITPVNDFVQSGVFAGPIAPGGSQSFKFFATKGQMLMFATMYANSNDLFFAPANPGLQLFNDDGLPITGDRSADIKLWDNGTRVNNDPTVAKPATSTTENKPVREIINYTDDSGYVYPEVSAMMRAELTFVEATSEFTMTISNISGSATVNTPFSGGAWVVSNLIDGEPVNKAPFFEQSKVSSTQLTAIAETGNTAPMATMTNGLTGIVTPLSPVLVVVYTGDGNPLFTVGAKDPGLGLSAVAQSGDATQLKASLERERNVRNVYVFGTQPIKPGEKAEGGISAVRGDKIALVTMFGYSNDWFFGNAQGFAAFYKGDVTANIGLYDNGTAINQYPGAGKAQHAFGGTNMPEDANITAVGNTYPVLPVNQMIKVTIR